MYGVQGMKKTMLLFLLGVSLFFHHGSGVLYMEEDLELEEELKLLNKPSIKTIQLEEGGDIFDCVDIYKQPAFDHPLLKDHKIQMQPSSYPSEKLDINRTTKDAMLIELPKISCPPRTVPIGRVTKEDLIRMKAHSKREANHTRRDYPSKAEDYIYWHATLNTIEGSFYGTRAHINVWGLHIYKQGWSSAQIFVRSGFSLPNNKLHNAVEAGWRVDPTLFGDSITRFFIYWTGDGYVNTGCYNHLCPGFVQTSNIVGLGAPVRPLSTIGGTQTELRLTIYKDPGNLNWWLLLHDDQPVGYWPSTLFSTMKYSAFEVFWGGNAGNPPSSDFLSPPMGNGRHIASGLAAYVDNIMLVDSNNNLYEPSKQPMHVSRGPVEDCYDLENDGYVNDKDGYKIIYGGPGGCSSPS